MPSQAAQRAEKLNWPTENKVFSPFPFGSMNQQDSRSGMPENELYWLENYIKIGAGSLRALWDIGPGVYNVATASPGNTIVSFFFFNIAEVNYAIVFLSNGTADQVNLATNQITHVSTAPNTFYIGGTLPACCQSGSQYLLISSNITNNAYWIWDGTLLYMAGTTGPTVTIRDSGSGYSSIPVITPFGGSGTGATFQATVSNGSVTAVNVTNPGSGYLPGDTVQLQFSGGGTDSGGELIAVLTATTISSISILSGGYNYSTSPNIVFTGGGGSGAVANCTVSGGVITSITLTSLGSGYTSVPMISFVGGGGFGAAAQAILTSTSVASVTVVNGGNNFIATPTIAFVGGGGTGATGTVSLSGGGISGVSIGAGGTGYTAVPAVEIEINQNNAAQATVELMPFGISGSSLETFQSRVWIAFPFQAAGTNTGGLFNVSAPESLTDFSGGSGGTSFTSNDRFLRAQYVNLRQSNGYLYPFGDSSTSVVSNVQTGGSPTSTTFNYQNTDPQIGASWIASFQDFGRTILFANPLGVFGLYGGNVQKISGKMDEIFQGAFPAGVVPVGALTPSSAVASIFKIKAYLILMTVFDPEVGANRNVILGWNERDWFLASQSANLIYIGTQEINSNLIAWGTDGSTLFQLMEQPSSTLQKKISSKLYGTSALYMTKETYALYVYARDRSSNAAGISMTGTVDTENATYSLDNAVSLPQPLPPDGSGNVFAAKATDAFGQMLGFTLISTSPDYSIENLVIAYQDIGALFG